MMLIRVLSIFGLGYFLSCGLRAINVVIAPQLRHDLSLTHSQLGVLSASYFIGFTALQLPIGVWLDRGLMRRLLSILLCIAALGSLIFALTDHFAVAVLGWGLAWPHVLWRHCRFIDVGIMQGYSNPWSLRRCARVLLGC